MKTYNLALIPGDGIGVDVTDAAMEVLGAAAKISPGQRGRRLLPRPSSETIRPIPTM